MGSEEAQLGLGQGPIAREMSWLVKICSLAMWYVSERNSFNTLPVQSPHTHRQMQVYICTLLFKILGPRKKENSGSTLQLVFIS